MKRKAASPDALRQPGAATAQAPEKGVLHDSTRVMRRPRRAWPPKVLIAAAILATAALALLAAACSGRPSSTGGSPDAGGSAASTSAVAYSHCIRSHGLPNWPDPTADSQGRPHFDVSTAGISHAYTHSPLFESKDRICERQVGGSAGVPVPMG